MSLESFLAAVAAFTLFPEDVREKAASAGPSLNEGQRVELITTLSKLHDDCAAIEKRRAERIDDAMRELVSMQHQFVPMIHEQIEHEESASALDALTKQMDDSPAAS